MFNRIIFEDYYFLKIQLYLNYILIYLNIIIFFFFLLKKNLLKLTTTIITTLLRRPRSVKKKQPEFVLNLFLKTHLAAPMLGLGLSLS